MAKHRRDVPATLGEQLLAEWGVSPSAPPADLAGVLFRDATADAAIAERLGAIATEESAALLQRIENEATDKAVRKAARRALYRLKQRGVCAPEAPPEPAATAPAPPPVEAYVSLVDNNGDQIVWLTRPLLGGLGRVVAIINDPVGLINAFFEIVSRKQLREERAAIERRTGVSLAPVDWRHADFIVHRAFEWARAAGARIPADYPAMRARIIPTPLPETPLPSPPADQAGSGAQDDDETLIAESSNVLTAPGAVCWMFTQEQVAPYMAEFVEAEQSPLVTTEETRGERFREMMHRAADRVFGGDASASWVRRLQENACYLSATGSSEHAAMLAAVARALEAGRAPRSIPLCEALVTIGIAEFVRSAMEGAGEGEGAGQEEKTSLVLTPRQAAEPIARR